MVWFGIKTTLQSWENQKSGTTCLKLRMDVPVTFVVNVSRVCWGSHLACQFLVSATACGSKVERGREKERGLGGRLLWLIRNCELAGGSGLIWKSRRHCRVSSLLQTPFSKGQGKPRYEREVGRMKLAYECDEWGFQWRRFSNTSDRQKKYQNPENFVNNTSGKGTSRSLRKTPTLRPTLDVYVKTEENIELMHFIIN